MPKQVDHRARREAIARALWTTVAQRGWSGATLREVAREADVSLGQLQHYFASRAEMLSFAIAFSAERTGARVAQATAALPQPPHPRDVLRAVLLEQLPLGPEAQATSRLQAAYVLEALHDPALREHLAAGLRGGRALVLERIQAAMRDGHIAADRDAEVETDLLLALTGFAPLLDLGALGPDAVRAAIDHHLDRLFVTDP